MSDYVKPAELARRLGVHKRTVYRWIAAGKLAAIRTPTGMYLIPAAEVESLTKGVTMNQAQSQAFAEQAVQLACDKLYADATHTTDDVGPTSYQCAKLIDPDDAQAIAEALDDEVEEWISYAQMEHEAVAYIRDVVAGDESAADTLEIMHAVDSQELRVLMAAAGVAEDDYDYASDADGQGDPMWSVWGTQENDDWRFRIPRR